MKTVLLSLEEAWSNFQQTDQQWLCTHYIRLFPLPEFNSEDSGLFGVQLLPRILFLLQPKMTPTTQCYAYMGNGIYQNERFFIVFCGEFLLF
jgi:hypothetical protein